MNMPFGLKALATPRRSSLETRVASPLRTSPRYETLKTPLPVIMLVTDPVTMPAVPRCNAARMLAELAGRQSTRGRVFVLGADGKPQALDVRLGISDGSMTELMMPANSPLADTLKVGAEVIVGTQSAAPRAAAGPRFSF